MKFLTFDIHLLTKPFLLLLLMLLWLLGLFGIVAAALKLDDVDGSSNSKLFSDDDDELESRQFSDFGFSGDSSRTNEVTDSVPSANRFRRFFPANLASGSRLLARSNMSRILGTSPTPIFRFVIDLGSVLLKSITAPAG